MGLVSWNDGLTQGLGRSGGRYRLSFERPSDGVGRGQWRIVVDDAELCAVDTAEGTPMDRPQSVCFRAFRRQSLYELCGR